MSRAIRFSKIHALNWYGYRDTLPVKGNLVLAGVTGSGKSILMDLLMLVLVGPERARHHFNRSATGGRSDRTIKGYCLLDTKREENGQPQYYHDKGVTTYIAAEFTWPDGERVETWGLRIEFRSAAETDGAVTPFFCPAALERDDFLTLSEDGKPRPSPLGAFKQLIASKGEGARLFSSSREYTRDMANPSHLNFNKDVLQRLLPSAMSFTNLKSFDDFCRQFVLPAEAVPVDDVISSFRDFQSYERELKDLRAQLDRLQRIRELSATLREAERDHVVAGYLSAEYAWKHAAAQEREISSRLERLKEENSGDEERLDEISELIRESTDTRERLTALLNESSEGKLYKRLADEIAALETDIEKLRTSANKVDGGIGKRIKSARNWMGDVAKAPLNPFVDVSRMESELKFLESCERGESANALSLLADAADDACKSIRRIFSKDAEELRKFRSEKSELKAQIDLLQRGISPGPQPLLTALKEMLPVMPGEIPPRALREICEVEDESWRVAAEMAFEEKFSVLVSPEHHDQALEILADLPDADLVKIGAQRLINAAALPENPKRNQGSLAEILRTSDETARACIDSLFGEMMRVSETGELTFHESAVSVSGLVKRGGTITRPAPYNGTPFIGEEGLKRQLEIKRHRLGEIDASLRRLEPLEAEVERLISTRQQEIPDHRELAKQLWELEDLPKKQTEHESRMKEFNAIATDEFDRLREEIDDRKQREAAWRNEERSILQKGKIGEIQRTTKELEASREAASRKEDEFSRVKLRLDITPHHTRYTEWKKDVEETFTTVTDALAGEFRKAAAKAELDATQATGELKVAMLDFKKTFHPKFDDLPDDGRDTSPYEQRLAVIENANIPDYEKKAATERTRWESLFRTQVLSRMQQAIKNVENIIALLNQQLKRPIGHDRYRIERKPNPDFRIYRELIDLNALHHEDELFFASMSGELRDALESFLGILVKSANSPEAARLLDYRQYFDYDLLVTDIRTPDAKPVSVDKQSGKMSGGENQSPYFVAILASYLHAYNRHESRRKEPSLALVPIDEAFSKLSGERIQNCIQAMAELDLQGMFSMSSGNIPYAFSQCDELIVISRKDIPRGVRNVPVVLFRDSPEGRRWIEEGEAISEPA